MHESTTWRDVLAVAIVSLAILAGVVFEALTGCL